MTRRSIAPPSGADLVEELRAAAQAKGVPLKHFVTPLVTSTASNFIQCLGRSARPMGLTIAKVRALIAGAAPPDPDAAQFSQQRGVKHMEVKDSEARIPSAEIEQRRWLTERAHAERRPGETVHAALRRLIEGGIDG